MRRLKALLLSLFTLAAVAVPAIAQIAPGQDPVKWRWEGANFRHSNAGSSVAAQANWAAPGGRWGSAFLDSTVFRVGTWAATTWDTTVAYKITDYQFQPGVAWRQAQLRIARGSFETSVQQSIPYRDSIISATPDTTATARWVTLRVEQDTTSNSFTGSTSWDSLLVAAQWSPDGINWNAVSGTPTRAFYSNPSGVAGGDGLALPAIAEAEVNATTETAEVDLECHPLVYGGNATYILNRTLCIAGGFVRWIVGVPGGTGQFKMLVGSWQPVSDRD